MSHILCIDTALDKATICLSKQGKLADADHNDQIKDHASWLHPAIDQLLLRAGLTYRDLEAVAVSIGPGSYTGLRVGLSAAKGYCYALKIPLIAIGTLELLAFNVKGQAIDYICPMIDARRMEVYTAVFDKNLIEKIPPLAMILHTNSFESLLANHHILFCGNGMHKIRPLLKSENASFTETVNLSDSLATMADMYNKKKNFSDIAYCEPLYLKDFHSST